MEAFGYENVRVEGFEADDVIASLAEQAKQAGVPVMIVTGDRDAYQLPDDGRVQVMTTSRGITDTRVYDREGVVERYGIPPELVPDFIGLKGDTSDNIPGVPGIGDKTAAQLLQQYGSLEGVLEHIDEISGEKRRQNLRENADLARISKELATLRRDIDAGIDVDRARRPGPRPLPAARGVRALRAARPAAAARGGARRRGGRAPRRGRERRVEATAHGSRAGRPGRARRRARPTLAAAATTTRVRWAAAPAASEVLAGTAETLAALLLAWGERPLVAHDWKSLGGAAGPPLGEPTARRRSPRALAHDTMVAAYLIDPARRAATRSTS